ncbi:MAG: LysM domain-containing protein [Desulfosalsimonadaceae bacterium]
MKRNAYSKIKYFLLFIALACLLPAATHADIEDHIIQTGSEFYYVVQKGDTLWDLSEKFSDSPWQWPEMWQHNPEIPNPHLIYPGQKIRIYAKTWEDGQKPAVTEAELPASDEYYTYAGINAIGFVRETQAENYGSIIKVKDDKRLMSTGDRMFIQPAENARPLVEGGIYAIYRTTGPVNDPVTDDYIGIQHSIAGIGEVVEVEDAFAVAEIVAVFRDIRKGDVIMPFEMRSEKIKLREPVDGLRGRLIKAESGRALIGEHMVAFMDKGSNDLVKPGQVYTLYYRETAPAARKGLDPILLTEESMGEMIVLHTENTTSTVLITNSVDAIPDGTAFKAAENNR